MASVIPRSVKKEITDGYVAETTWKVALCTNAFVPTALMTTYASITNEVPNGSGYTTGGAELLGRSSAYVGNDAKFDATDLAWSSASFSCRYAVLYETTGGKIRGIYDLGDQTVNSGTLTLLWNTSGILTVA
jgi:hypothetical protein